MFEADRTIVGLTPPPSSPFSPSCRPVEGEISEIKRIEVVVVVVKDSESLSSCRIGLLVVRGSVWRPILVVGLLWRWRGVVAVSCGGDGGGGEGNEWRERGGGRWGEEEDEGTYTVKWTRLFFFFSVFVSFKEKGVEVASFEPLLLTYWKDVSWQENRIMWRMRQEPLLPPRQGGKGYGRAARNTIHKSKVIVTCWNLVYIIFIYFLFY